MATATKKKNRKLARAIEASGMTQYELAFSIRVSESQVSRWVNGAKPHRLMQPVIAQALDVKPEELWPA